MNKVILEGLIANCKPSHSCGQQQYSKCQLIEGDNVIDVIYKTDLQQRIKDGDVRAISGTIRTKADSTNVCLYVYTYLDPVQIVSDANEVTIDGIVTKKEELYTYPNGKSNIHFVVKNVIEVNGHTFVTSIPCVAKNNLAVDADQLKIGQKVSVKGKLTSRTFVKKVDSEDIFKTTHEVLVGELNEGEL